MKKIEPIGLVIYTYSLETLELLQLILLVHNKTITMEDSERIALEKKIRKLKSELIFLRIYVLLSFIVVFLNFIMKYFSG